MSSPSSPNLVNHYCLVIQSAVSNLLDATLNPLKTCLFHLSLRIQPEGAYMATINSIMSSICQPGPIGPYNVDLRFDIIVEGDVSVKSYRAGSSEPMFQDTAMQTELRLWSGPASDHKGIFKPDTMCVLKVTVLETGVQSQLLSLVGEGKANLFSGGVPVGSSDSESRDNASALTANDRTREGKKWRIGTAKVMVYLLSAHQAFGTYLGITIVGPKFARLLHLGDDLIALECEDTFFNNMSVSDHSQLASAFLSNLDNLDHLPHILSSSSNNRDVSLNNAALDTMLETYRAAASIFLNLPATQHLSRIPPHDPTAPLTSAIIYRAIQHNISDDRERFHLVEHCRRGVIWKSPPQPLSRTRRRENDREDDGGPGQGGTRGFESSKRRSARLEERRQGERAKESGRSTRAGQVDGRTRSDMAKENG